MPILCALCTHARMTPHVLRCTPCTVDPSDMHARMGTRAYRPAPAFLSTMHSHARATCMRTDARPRWAPCSCLLQPLSSTLGSLLVDLRGVEHRHAFGRYRGSSGLEQVRGCKRRDLGLHATADDEHPPLTHLAKAQLSAKARGKRHSSCCRCCCSESQDQGPLSVEA